MANNCPRNLVNILPDVHCLVYYCYITSWPGPRDTKFATSGETPQQRCSQQVVTGAAWGDCRDDYDDKTDTGDDKDDTDTGEDEDETDTEEDRDESDTEEDEDETDTGNDMNDTDTEEDRDETGSGDDNGNNGKDWKCTDDYNNNNDNNTVLMMMINGAIDIMLVMIL